MRDATLRSSNDCRHCTSVSCPGSLICERHSRGCLIEHLALRYKGRDVASACTHTHQMRCWGAMFEPSAPPVSRLSFRFNERSKSKGLPQNSKDREISQSSLSLVLSMNVVFDNKLALWQMPSELNESDIIIYVSMTWSPTCPFHRWVRQCIGRIFESEPVNPVGPVL